MKNGGGSWHISANLSAVGWNWHAGTSGKYRGGDSSYLVGCLLLCGK